MSVLPTEATEAVGSFIKEGHHILIGDCYGVDLCVQRLLKTRGYKEVTVYCSGDAPRYNEGGWTVNALHIEGMSGYEFYRQKDIVMAADCDCGYMIWDGVSKGTRQNIEDLKLLGKPVEVASKNRLCKGVFWRKEKLLGFFIPCNENGEPIGNTEYPLESKDGTNYNHKKLLGRLPRSVTEGHAFDYYPRGRVEIAKGKATVFLHPSLCTSEVELEIANTFGLVVENNIRSVRFVADGSSHYNASIQEIK